MGFIPEQNVPEVLSIKVEPEEEIWQLILALKKP
jgi:hypothetical protein